MEPTTQKPTDNPTFAMPIFDAPRIFKTQTKGRDNLIFSICWMYMYRLSDIFACISDCIPKDMPSDSGNWWYIS